MIVNRHATNTSFRLRDGISYKLDKDYFNLAMIGIRLLPMGATTTISGCNSSVAGLLNVMLNTFTFILAVTLTVIKQDFNSNSTCTCTFNNL